MESQMELNDERKRLLAKFLQALPEVTRAEYTLLSEVYKEGALSTKIKRLVAQAIVCELAVPTAFWLKR
jgi:alkylhydroperoxidase/carboxymuconolactone decarboxylase family protein YurZ